MRFAATTAAVVLNGGAVAANGDADAEAAAVSAKAAHPSAPEGALFFQSFDEGSPSFKLSEYKDYAGQDVKVRTVDGRLVSVEIVTLLSLMQLPTILPQSTIGKSPSRTRLSFTLGLFGFVQCIRRRQSSCPRRRRASIRRHNGYRWEH